MIDNTNRRPDVLKALVGSTQPLTCRSLQVLCDISATSLKKHLRAMRKAGAAHVVAWTKVNGRTWTPMWAAGGGADVPMPESADDQPERGDPLHAPLQAPDSPFKTKFVGQNPWLLIAQETPAPKRPRKSSSQRSSCTTCLSLLSLGWPARSAESS